MVMTFASEYFPHVIAAALGFGAFALLLRERRGPPRLVRSSALAGLLAGLAVTLRVPARPASGRSCSPTRSRAQRRGFRARRSYAAGAVLGAAPALAFNQWAFGSPLQFAYGDAVAVQGPTGHAVLGLNDGGFFGISLPRPGSRRSSCCSRAAAC